VSTVAMMVAAILQPALVALGRNRAAMLAWAASSALFIALLFAPVAPLAAAVTAQLVAPTLVCLLMLVALRQEFQSRAAAPAAPPGQPFEPTVTNSL